MQMNSLRIVGLLVAVIATFLIPSSASAQAFYFGDSWTGGGGNSYWSNPANWSDDLPFYPNNTNSELFLVTIDTGHTDSVILDTGVTIDSLVLGGMTGSPVSTLTLCDCVFDIDGPLTVNKTGRLDSSEGGTRLRVTGDTVVEGRVDDSLGTMTFKSLTNAGTISVYGSGTLPSHFTATSITNSGDLNVTDNSTLSCAGIYTQTKGTTFVGGSSIVIEGGITYFVGLAEIKARSFSIGGGTLSGGGYLDGDVDVSGGKIAPTQANLTSMVVFGEFSQENDKSEIAETFGTDPANYPFTTATTAFLTVTGSAYVNGTLTVTEPTGYTPFVGQTTPVVVSDSGIAGTFTKLNLPALPAGDSWQINYNAVYDDHPAIVITVVAAHYLIRLQKRARFLTCPAIRLIKT
jgi:hypothetical protein